MSNWLVQRLLGAAICLLLPAAGIALAAASPASERRPGCLGRVATIVRGDGDSRIRGTSGSDVIVAGGGDDRVAGLGGKDRICAGGGEDRVRSGGGDDRVKAGAGRDLVRGGNGSDRIRGRDGDDLLIGQLGSDRIRGGAGDDRLDGGRGNDRVRGDRAADHVDGGLGDDLLSGGAGDADRLIGDLGNDKLDGDGGDGDVVRGDFGRDLLDGGPGSGDIASFSSAAGEGVEVNLAAGRASGDGEDRLVGVEDVVGSALADLIRGDGSPNRIDGNGGDDRLFGGDPLAAPALLLPGPPDPGDEAFGGHGTDLCAEFEATHSCEGDPPRSRGRGTAVEMVLGLDGPSITVRGTEAPNRIQLRLWGEELLLSDAAGLDPDAVSGCALLSPTLASCPYQRSLGFVVIEAGVGNDVVLIGQSLPARLPIRASGGPGRDRISGGRGHDVIEGGRGDDDLRGRQGGDALVSGFDADRLSGGSGADLLVAAGACTGDRLRGGDGTDSASFARVVAGVVRARIGAHAVNLDRIRLRAPCRRVRIQASIENLEGSPGSDILIGDGRRNNLLGRGGGDTLRGRDGRDRLVAGGGRDALFGGAGPDRLYARDRRADRRIDCGRGRRWRERATRDRVDPAARRC